MTDAARGAAGGPGISQERRLLTEIPGPVSRAKLARRQEHVAAGVGTTLPVFVEAAGGGIIVDADGNALIDLASGIAVVSVGNAAPAVVERVTEQVAKFTHTCFMVTPYDGYVDVCEQLAELTPGTHAKKSALFNSGAEAVENAVKIARAATGRQAIGVVDHAYHGRTNLTMAMTAKNMPYKHSFGPFAGEVYRAPMSYPFRERSPISGEEAADRAIDVLEKQAGAANLSCLVIEPILGEGGFVVPADGFLPACASGPRRAASCSSPTRSRPASAARASGSPATTKVSCPTWSPLPRASPAASRSPRSPGAPRSWTRCTSAVWAAPTAATRSPALPRSAPSRP